MVQKKYSIEKIQSACRLRQIREGAGLSQEKFAEVLGISLAGYKKVESGENNISLSSLKKLHKSMGVSADFILYGDLNNAENIWQDILNCSEKDKLLLMFRLFFYFTEIKKVTFPFKEEQTEVDKLIEQLIKKLQDNGE